MLGQHLDRTRVLANAISLRRIDLDNIAPSAEATKTNQVLDILGRIEVLASREWVVVRFDELTEQRKVERVAGFFEPAQLEGRERLGVAQCFVASEFAIRVDSETVSRTDDFEHRLKTPKVFREWQASDLHLDHCVACAEVTPHLVLQILDGLPGPVLAAAHVAEHFGGDLAAIEALRQQGVQRLVGDLCDCIP